MRYREFKLTEQQLDELKMSTGSLRAFAKSPVAQGIQAGFEAELIFPGLAGDLGGMEPDYDYDERAEGIEDIINFFSNDDHGWATSDRTLDRLRSQLEEEFWEWRDSLMMQEFDDRAYELIRDYIEENEWDEDDVIRGELEGQGFDAAQIDDIIKRAREATSTRNTPKEYLDAYEAANQELDARAERSKEDQDEFYDAALDEFRDDWDSDNGSVDVWLREEG